MARAEEWGVADGFHLVNGDWREAPRETVAAILSTMGGADRSPPADDGPLFVRGGEAPPLPRAGAVLTEEGAEIAVGPNVPADLPFGYHTFIADGVERRLIVSPGECVLPERRTWGWALQLYAARSRSSWGIGDLGDLRRLAAWSAAELGGGFVMVNPLHASLPALPQTASPYFPSSRRFRNPLLLRVEDIPGAAGLEDDLDGLAEAGRRLNDDRRIDRDAVYRLKVDAFERVFSAFRGDARFDAFCSVDGPSLERYATFCVLDEQLGRPWSEWPERYRHPDSPPVGAFRREHHQRVRFHKWLQWLLALQLERAAAEGPLILDLAVGVDPAGADAWLWQDVMALGMSVGAPPDEFNTRGQDWGLPPFDPWKLRSADYEPFIQTVRAVLGHGGGVRLDHVMGLFRLYWMPRGAPPTEGTYVHYPAADLLDIVALESYRSGAYVVGEDLGTVEPRVRSDLADRKVLSYRLLWFEQQPPGEWPEQAMAAVTTHDLPTVAGLWSGSDLEAQRAIDVQPNEEATKATRDHLQQVAAVSDPDASPAEVVEGAYRALAESPCLLLAATLDDALEVEERPNMPGTIDEWPNWSIALPAPLEDIESDPRPRRLAELLRRREAEDS